MFYFGNYRPEVLLFCERPCLTAVDARRRTFVGWEETSVSQRLQLLTVSCGGTGNTEGAAEHMRTRGHANQRGTGALRGSGKWERWSEKKKQKKNGRRADCLDERHQSKLLSEHRRSEREGKKKSQKVGQGLRGVPPVVVSKSMSSVFVSRRRSFGHTPRTSGPPWSGSGFTFCLRVQETAPGASRASWPGSSVSLPQHVGTEAQTLRGA